MGFTVTKKGKWIVSTAVGVLLLWALSRVSLGGVLWWTVGWIVLGLVLGIAVSLGWWIWKKTRASSASAPATPAATTASPATPRPSIWSRVRVSPTTWKWGGGLLVALVLVLTLYYVWADVWLYVVAAKDVGVAKGGVVVHDAPGFVSANPNVMIGFAVAVVFGIFAKHFSNRPTSWTQAMFLGLAAGFGVWVLLSHIPVPEVLQGVKGSVAEFFHWKNKNPINGFLLLCGLGLLFLIGTSRLIIVVLGLAVLWLSI